MKNSLTRTELTGIILLAILVAAIVSASFIFKECRSVPQTAEPVVVEIKNQDTESVPSSSVKNQKERKTKKSGSRRKKSATTKSSKAVRVDRKDPFTDTVPTAP